MTHGTAGRTEAGPSTVELEIPGDGVSGGRKMKKFISSSLIIQISSPKNLPHILFYVMVTCC